MFEPYPAIKMGKEHFTPQCASNVMTRAVVVTTYLRGGAARV
jgi:hypothetical protein